MTRWPVPPVPQLPAPDGDRPPVRLHDTATGERRPAANGPDARLYVCGITPYDATHMGHAATYLAFDLLLRAWRDAGFGTRYVQNVTDVDDPLLERASATGVDWRELARDQTELFATDMAALRVLPPDVYEGATEAVPRIVRIVTELLEQGWAYRVSGDGEQPEGDVYFSVHADPDFGSVSHLAEPAMLEVFAERGGDPDRAGKKHPLDALLWRVERPGEPAWDGGPLGAGRPGWHIECTAIALEHLGAGFDVQGGGSDLVFPHHEMSASHAHLAGAHPFAQAYAHAGMVGLDGHKMSKSRGNLVLMSRLRAAGVEPAAIRLAVLAHHYRSDWEWTEQGLEDAVRRLARWREAVALPAGPAALPLLAQVRERLADDLDAPGALAAVDAWVTEALDQALDAGSAAPGADEKAPALVRDTVDALLGIAL
ncbi:MAG TPA: cysteine--1-D-myo-inosityl 2-amino-2-deoxy-alpha-D-glucopyranoside ligase [Kineosporiaceae bacterium]|nr:cysteine--1-D-myo-inosityl 2-amino-2-deoxy-alpha-D-glucopyranoside ligase [Kineosporiaceae bacterium]